MTNEQALIHLLRDDDPDTVNLVKEQLVERGPEAIGDLEHLMAVDDANVSRHAREVLEEIQLRQAEHDFGMSCYFFPENADLEEACWLLARAVLPGIDTASYQHQVDVWGRKLALRVAGALSTRERVATLSHFVAKELGV